MILSAEEKARRQKILDDPKKWPKCQVCGKPITWQGKPNMLNRQRNVRWQYWLKRKTCSKGCKYQLQSERQTTGLHKKRRYPTAYRKQTNIVDSEQIIAVATAVGPPVKPGFYVFDMSRPRQPNPPIRKDSWL